jgi:predicted dehydrogenase
MVFHIVIIGAGTIAKEHVEAYRKMEHVKVKAIVDINEDSARELADTIGAHTYTRIEEALEDPAINAVDICLPTFLHIEMVTYVAKRKKHIICEKPIALSVREAKEMYSICEQEGVQLCIAHVCRFMHAYREMARVIRECKMGDVQFLRMTRAVRYPIHLGRSWYQDTEKSGGPFIDFLIHDFDFLTWCFGKPIVTSSSQVSHRFMEAMVVTLEYKRGPLVRIEGVWSSTGYDDLHQRLEVEGTNGYASYDSRGLIPWIMENTDGERIQYSQQQLRNDPFYDELHHFVHCFLGKEEPIISREQILSTLQVAIEARELSKK